MANVYAGPDGQYLTGLELQEAVENGGIEVVLSYEDEKRDLLAVERPDGRTVWWVGISESELPDGVEVQGLRIADDRDE
jgi:hypothetical protein